RREHGVDHWDIVRPRALDERLEPADLARRLRHPVRTPARLDELILHVDDEQRAALGHDLQIRPATRVRLPSERQHLLLAEGTQLHRDHHPPIDAYGELHDRRPRRCTRCAWRHCLTRTIEAGETFPSWEAGM